MSKPETHVVWKVDLAERAAENLSVGTEGPVGVDEADEKVTTIAGATYGTLVVFGDRPDDNGDAVNDSQRWSVLDWAKQHLRSWGLYPVVVQSLARSFVRVFGVHEATVTETGK